MFKVGEKCFVITSVEPGGNFLSLKVSAENFATLTEKDGIIPAPYLARAQWLALERSDTLNQLELRPLLREAYEIVRAKLPRKVRAALPEEKAPPVRKQR